VIHYHGTPITPAAVLSELAGRCFCVSWAAPANLARCHEIGQSVMLDNGAFSIWRRATRGSPLPARLRAVAEGGWSGYHDWAEPWLEYPTTWAVIPDAIGGGEEENDALLRHWVERRLPRGAPVWHMHESIGRLRRLAEAHERVCIGSSGQFAQVGGERWRRRMDAAMSAICGSGPVPVWLHMLRGMALGGSEYPFASVDSTDIARNHSRERRRGRSAAAMAARWDGRQNPARWRGGEQLAL
jgi:hypothetical protein